MNITYTREEKRKIIKTLNYMIKDMYDLLKTTSTDELHAQTSLGNLTIDKKRIYIYAGYKKFKNTSLIDKVCTTFVDITDMFVMGSYYRTALESKYELPLGRKNLLGMKFLFNSQNLNYYISLIEEYQNIREQLLKKSEEILTKKGTIISDVDRWYKRFSGETQVEIDLPKTQNIHEFELEEVGSQKIGTINFGGRTIKLITDGDIVLVNKKAEPQKVKRK